MSSRNPKLWTTLGWALSFFFFFLWTIPKQNQHSKRLTAFAFLFCLLGLLLFMNYHISIFKRKREKVNNGYWNTSFDLELFFFFLDFLSLCYKTSPLFHLINTSLLYLIFSHTNKHTLSQRKEGKETRNGVHEGPLLSSNIFHLAITCWSLPRKLW